MRKKDELSRDYACMHHAHPNEMTFVLLGRDPAAPVVIRAWIDERIRLGKNTSGDWQTEEARDYAITMEMEGRKWVGAVTHQIVLDDVEIKNLAESTTAIKDRKSVDARTCPMEHIMQFFAYDHLPAALQEVSRPFGEIAHVIVDTLPHNPERIVALRKLLEAKDAAVRALVAKT